MQLLAWLIYGHNFMIKPKAELVPFYDAISNKTGLSVEFITAHAQQESNQYFLAVGKAGEYGLWQFLPKTWTGLMGSANWKDVNNQSLAYVKHANFIIKTLNLNPLDKSDLKKFLWVWNAGLGNYKKKVLPTITVDYITRILANV